MRKVAEGKESFGARVKGHKPGVLAGHDMQCQVFFW